MGVTTLSQVNGRGAYSAREVTRHLSGEERLAHARSLIGGSMKKNAKKRRPSMVQSLRSNSSAAKARGKRVAAYSAAIRNGKSRASAKRSALARAPFTPNERRSGASFMGTRARMTRNDGDTVSDTRASSMSDVASTQKRRDRRSSTPTKTRDQIKAETKALRDKMKSANAALRDANKELAKFKKEASKAKTESAKLKGQKKAEAAAKRAVAASHRRDFLITRRGRGRSASSRKVRVAYQGVRRARLTNPSTGRLEYSYMTRGKGGRLTRIPTWRLLGLPNAAAMKNLSEADKKRLDKIVAGRRKAADKLIERGGAFIANRSKKMKKRKRRRALTAPMVENKRTTKKRKATRKKAARKKTKTVVRKKRPVRRKAAKRRVAKRTVAKRTKRRSSRKGSAASKRVNALARKLREKNPRLKWKTALKQASARLSGSKKSAKKPKRRKAKKTTRKASGKRRSGAKARKSRKSSKRMMRRNSFMAKLQDLSIKGLYLGSGIITHRLVNFLVNRYGVSRLDAKYQPYAGAAASVGTAAAGIYVVGALPFAADKKMLIQAGMVADVIIDGALFLVRKFLGEKYAAPIQGYSSGRAYALRGVGDQMSIMPRYAAVGALPGFSQAAAGIGEYFAPNGLGAAPGFMQAQAGIGEYFAPNRAAARLHNAKAMGEYFTPNGTKGVGSYEGAGPLAMQAAAGVDEIQDGIRPDSNLDKVLDLAEAQAGVGEFFTAAPQPGGGYTDATVPQESQWIPHGPLWAGAMQVDATKAQTEEAAGILAGPGDNGTLSG
jgi:hypothetical protein